MVKQELIKAIANETDMTQKDTKIFLDAAIEVVKETLINGEDISLVGFGSFKVVDTPAREGIISFGSHKGEKYVTESGHKVKFKVSKELKDAIK